MRVIPNLSCNVHTYPFSIVFFIFFLFFFGISLFSEGESSKMAWEHWFHLKENPIDLFLGSGVI